MKIKVHITDKEPDGVVPFTMTPDFVWKLYDSGDINAKEMHLWNVLYRNVNAYNGTGTASHTRICTWMHISPTKQNVNAVTKMMARLRKLQLIWFPDHKGVRDFAYVLSDFKRAKKLENTPPDWVDIKPYFQTSNQTKGISEAESHPEPAQRRAPENQRSEHRNSAGLQGIGEVISRMDIRPPHTNND